MKNKCVRMDILIILACSLTFAVIFILFEGSIMEYAGNQNLNILQRFLPVLAVQFGMSCLGIDIVLIRNREKLSDYGFIRKNSLKSILGCLAFSLPTVLFLWYFNDIHPLFPFRGMFLTTDILHSGFPLNVVLYFIVALVWGVGEGSFYVVFSEKLNRIIPPKQIWNPGAFISAIFAVLIHGMIGTDLKTVLEAAATFILMYGSVWLKDKVHNSWGNVAIFFVIWNAL